MSSFAPSLELLKRHNYLITKTIVTFDCVLHNDFSCCFSIPLPISYLILFTIYTTSILIPFIVHNDLLHLEYNSCIQTSFQMFFNIINQLTIQYILTTLPPDILINELTFLQLQFSQSSTLPVSQELDLWFQPTIRIHCR